MELQELQAVAKNTARRGEYSTALRARFWAIKKGDEEYYDLACMYARNGMSEQAFYWLQIAAHKEGVDPNHAESYEDAHAFVRWMHR